MPTFKLPPDQEAKFLSEAMSRPGTRVTPVNQAALPPGNPVRLPPPPTTPPSSTPSRPRKAKGTSSRSGKPARPKYGNQKSWWLPSGEVRRAVAGLPGPPGCILFDSTKEARRWVQLRAELAAGRIVNLARQVRLRVYVNDREGTPQLVCTYVADFAYVRAGRYVVEDVKSEMTKRLPIYLLKRKLVRIVLGHEIQEV